MVFSRSSSSPPAGAAGRCQDGVTELKVDELGALLSTLGRAGGLATTLETRTLLNHYPRGNHRVRLRLPLRESLTRNLQR
jgi:hypothetical protein